MQPLVDHGAPLVSINGAEAGGSGEAAIRVDPSGDARLMTETGGTAGDPSPVFVGVTGPVFLFFQPPSPSIAQLSALRCRKWLFLRCHRGRVHSVVVRPPMSLSSSTVTAEVDKQKILPTLVGTQPVTTPGQDGVSAEECKIALQRNINPLLRVECPRCLAAVQNTVAPNGRFLAWRVPLNGPFMSSKPRYFVCRGTRFAF